MAPHPLPLEYSIDVRDYFRHADAGGCSFDAQHVPQINYDLVFRAHRILSGRTFGTHYNITSVCQYGLGALSLFLETGEERFRELFSAQAKWLSENLVTIRNSYGVWQYQFPFLPYRLKPPFVSGMAQGQGLSVLVRAWQLCQDPRYMDQAHLVFNSFAVQVSEGGVKQLTPQGRTWYEEYPTEPPSYVLNGYIFALFGIRDYYLATMSKPAQFAWEEGISTLKAMLPNFDTGYWSRYDLHPGRVSTPDYHALHIRQLNVLYEITGEVIFRTYAEKWKLNQERRSYRVFAAARRFGIARKLKAVGEALRERTAQTI